MAEKGLMLSNNKLTNEEKNPLMNPGMFKHLLSVAERISKSDLIPVHYKGKPDNVLITLQMALRLNVDPMMMMQNTYIIAGKPGIEAKLAIALINSSGIYDGPLNYEIKGSAKSEDLACRAWTKRKCERVDGPWVTWDMVKAEGWLTRNGSKWKTMPELMIQYRAATFFGRLKCPERLMGMQTIDELHDTTQKTSRPLISDRLQSAIGEPVKEAETPAESESEPFSETVEGETVDKSTGEIITGEKAEQEPAQTTKEEVDEQLRTTYITGV